MKQMRHSVQRDAIYNELCRQNDHPTADELYARLKTDYPNLSLATVYRNLRQLSDLGKVNILYTESADHFDGIVSPHYHFYCRECRRIYDADIPLIPEIVRAGERIGFGTIESYRLVFQGVCEHCMNLKTN